MIKLEIHEYIELSEEAIMACFEDNDIAEKYKGKNWIGNMFPGGICQKNAMRMYHSVGKNQDNDYPGIPQMGEIKHQSGMILDWILPLYMGESELGFPDGEIHGAFNEIIKLAKELLPQEAITKDNSTKEKVQNYGK